MSSSIVDCFLKVKALPPIDLAVRQLALAEKQAQRALFSQDPGLALKLVRKLGASGELNISELYHQATSNQLQEIINWAQKCEPLSNALPGPDYYLFWRTSLHRSVLARALASLAGLPNTEALATAALLQEAALPMLLRCLSQAQAQSFPGFHVSLRAIVQWSRSSLGADHRALGASLFAGWQLPELILQSQKMEISPADQPALKLLELARLAAESFYAEDVELAMVQHSAKRWMDLEPRPLNEAIASSLLKLSELSLNKIMCEELDISGAGL